MARFLGNMSWWLNVPMLLSFHALHPLISNDRCEHIDQFWLQHSWRSPGCPNFVHNKGGNSGLSVITRGDGDRVMV